MVKAHLGMHRFIMNLTGKKKWIFLGLEAVQAVFAVIAIVQVVRIIGGVA